MTFKPVIIEDVDQIRGAFFSGPLRRLYG